MFKKILDNTDPGSLANKFRRKRFKLFTEQIKNIPRPVRILDAGGTVNFWEQMRYAGNNDYEITLVNLNLPDITNYNNLTLDKGDATNLAKYKDKSFDVVFSNSVIEHIPTAAGRQKMADEIRRVGKLYFVQTPDYYFPFEPHFLFPCFQFFPVSLKIFMLKNFSMGWFKKCKNNDEALRLLEYNKLLKPKEFISYFPGSKIFYEKFLLLNKSITVFNI